MTNRSDPRNQAFRLHF